MHDLISPETVDAVMTGEMAGEMASPSQIAIRRQYILRRVGTTRSRATLNSMIDSCQHTPGVWDWGGGCWTVFDIRPRAAD